MQALASTTHRSRARRDYWAELYGCWFFAWRMAAACEQAMREVQTAMGHNPHAHRLPALEKAKDFFYRELLRWVRRGEALDIIIQRVPSQHEEDELLGG